MKSRKKRVVAKTKLNKYETYELEQPEMPNFTCPHIDEVVDWSHKIIDKMEEIRTKATQMLYLLCNRISVFLILKALTSGFLSLTAPLVVAYCLKIHGISLMFLIRPFLIRMN